MRSKRKLLLPVILGVVVAFVLSTTGLFTLQILERGKIFLESSLSSMSVEHLGEGRGYVPNDPKFDEQHSITESDFPQAWAVSRGENVKVAVVDSGIAADHPDLSSKIIDQKDFLDEDETAEDGGVGHGSLIAGVIAANTDNGKGIAGGCPGCDLLIAKSLDLFGGNESDIAKAIRWSADQGAEVINVSFSGPETRELKSAVDYAQDKGVVIVAAAPNQGTSALSYPAAYENVLAVVTADRAEQDMPPAKYGDWVDVAAGGDSVLSTAPGGRYRQAKGTNSLATAQVSALAALLAAKGYSPVEVRKRIKHSATDIGPSGEDPYFGSGRISAAQALQ